MTSAPKAATGEFHIPSLDGIRAVSFMLVFLAHAGLYAIVPGGLGVTIFFFLSGYLITTLLRLEYDRTGQNSLRDFYLRRAFRILPPFYTILGLAFALGMAGLLPEKPRMGAMLAQLTHITNYYLIFANAKGFPAGTVVYWSLAVEEHFYLVFPFVFILLQRKLPGQLHKQAMWLLALCGVVLAWRFVLALVLHTSAERTGLASDTRVDSIVFGCVLAMTGNPMLDPWRGTAARWRVLFFGGCALMVFSVAYRADWFRETLRYTLQGIALVPMFVVAIRDPQWGPMRLLNWAPVRRVGLLSYSLYLCHQVILVLVWVASPTMNKLLSGSLSLALALLFSTAMLHWIERPAGRARKNWVKTNWLKPVPQEAAVTADAPKLQLDAE